MNLLPKAHFERMRMRHQRGVVLFFALVALLAMSLAAVALIRSVDTSTIIAGNLAFKRAATTSGDAGAEQAVNWLATTDNANSAFNILTVQGHPFNNNHGAGAYLNNGYYSGIDPTLSLTNSAAANHVKWDDTDSMLVTTSDISGNEVRYVIQRMCRTTNQMPGNGTNGTTDCLYSGAFQSNGDLSPLLPQEVCYSTTGGCPRSGQSPMYVVTSRIAGPKLTVSYVQAFVY